MAGLRERKREKTRDEIVEAALVLFEKHGFDATTIDEIAAAAEVSPRTVYRYFPTKEDLVFLGQEEENRRVAAIVKATPRGADALGTVLRATRSILLERGPSSEQIVRSHRLMRATPSLRAYKAKLLHHIEELIAGALVPSHATRAEQLRGRMMAAVYLAALDVAIASWIEAGAKGTPEHELDLVQSVVERAFPPVSSSSKTRPRRKSP